MFLHILFRAEGEDIFSRITREEGQFLIKVALRYLERMKCNKYTTFPLSR